MIGCDTFFENHGKCPCLNNPEAWTDPRHPEGVTGHVETLPNGTITGLCETCRTDPKDRRVTDEMSVPVIPPKKVYKDFDPKKIVKLR